MIVRCFLVPHHRNGKCFTSAPLVIGAQWLLVSGTLGLLVRLIAEAEAFSPALSRPDTVQTYLLAVWVTSAAAMGCFLVSIAVNFVAYLFVSGTSDLLVHPRVFVGAWVALAVSTLVVYLGRASYRLVVWSVPCPLVGSSASAAEAESNDALAPSSTLAQSTGMRLQSHATFVWKPSSSRADRPASVPFSHDNPTAARPHEQDPSSGCAALHHRNVLLSLAVLVPWASCFNVMLAWPRWHALDVDHEPVAALLRRTRGVLSPRLHYLSLVVGALGSLNPIAVIFLIGETIHVEMGDDKAQPSSLDGQEQLGVQNRTTRGRRPSMAMMMFGGACGLVLHATVLKSTVVAVLCTLVVSGCALVLFRNALDGLSRVEPTTAPATLDQWWDHRAASVVLLHVSGALVWIMLRVNVSPRSVFVFNLLVFGFFVYAAWLQWCFWHRHRTSGPPDIMTEGREASDGSMWPETETAAAELQVHWTLASVLLWAKRGGHAPILMRTVQPAAEADAGHVFRDRLGQLTIYLASLAPWSPIMAFVLAPFAKVLASQGVYRQELLYVSCLIGAVAFVLASWPGKRGPFAKVLASQGVYRQELLYVSCLIGAVCCASPLFAPVHLLWTSTMEQEMYQLHHARRAEPRRDQRHLPLSPSRGAPSPSSAHHFLKTGFHSLYHVLTLLALLSVALGRGLLQLSPTAWVLKTFDDVYVVPLAVHLLFGGVGILLRQGLQHWAMRSCPTSLDVSSPAASVGATAPQQQSGSSFECPGSPGGRARQGSDTDSVEADDTGRLVGQ